MSVKGKTETTREVEIWKITSNQAPAGKGKTGNKTLRDELPVTRPTNFPPEFSSHLFRVFSSMEQEKVEEPGTSSSANFIRLPASQQLFDFQIPIRP